MQCCTRSRYHFVRQLLVVVLAAGCLLRSNQTFAMAAMREGATRIWSSLARSGAALFKGSARVRLQELSQQQLKEAVETLVKGRVPELLENPLKKFISGPVVDRATIEVFERDVAQKAETPSTSFLRYFQKNAYNKELNVPAELLKELESVSKASQLEQQQQSLGVIKKLLNTPEGRFSIDTSLGLFKKTAEGQKVWPQLEEGLRQSIENALQKVEVKFVSLPADYWKQGRLTAIPYGDALAGKLHKDIFSELNIPKDVLAQTLKGITPPPLVTTAPEPVSAYGSPYYPATQSGQLVVRTVPAGIPGQPSEALLRGTAERQLVIDPAVAGAIVSRRSSDKQLVLSDTGIDLLGTALDALGKEANSTQHLLVPSSAAIAVINKITNLVPQQTLVPVFVQPSCLPETMTFEGNSSSILNGAGDVLAIIGHSKVNGYMPALVARSVAEQFEVLQKATGYAACMQPVMMIDTQNYSPKLLEDSKSMQPGALSTLALYIPPTVERLQAMKAASALPKPKKNRDSAVVKELKTDQEAKTGKISTVGTEVLKKVLGEAFDAEDFYRSLLLRTVKNEFSVEDGLVTQWVNAGGPEQLSLNAAGTTEKLLTLFHAYNELLGLIKKGDKEARESLDALKLSIITVLGEDENVETIQQRLEVIKGA